ncbi:MAG: imidazoleglycerol-phosphate dehydratase HisB [Desulfohalobiaceae bacterium]|nr:imidazoleglycerol-phosphate dehydratase HisB [Desulfohalobiaceae bacterium]
MVPGKAEYTRETQETRVTASLNLYGSGEARMDTDLGCLDHMLHLFAFWAGFDLELTARGDLHVDAHHTVEDCGLCLGRVLHEAAGGREGLRRVGWAKVPMDEALAEAVLDLSGRPYLVYRGTELPAVIFGQEKDIWREFFKSLAHQAGMNLHIYLEYGENGHHLLEAAFKALGLALGQALAPGRDQLPSTKGAL